MPSLNVLVDINPVSVVIISTYLSAVLQFFCSRCAISCTVLGFCFMKSIILSVSSFVSIVQHSAHFLCRKKVILYNYICISMEKYVITGGPCTGKTTMTTAMQNLGFIVTPESARQIIEEEQRKDSGILPWTDFAGFQRLVIRRQIALEERVCAVDTVFCDRSGVDGVAYCWLGGVAVPDELAAYVKNAKFSGVFLLDRLQYKNDDVRMGDEATAGKIHGLIATAYQTHGYDVICVPVLPVEQRVDFIMNKIKQTR